MSRFIIAPHMRLQEWVAEEKGYFKAEGLDYEFREQLTSKQGVKHDLGSKDWRISNVRSGPNCECGLRVPLDR